MALTEPQVLDHIRSALDEIKVPGALDAGMDTTWAELDVDSLELVELVQNLEEAYDVSIHDDSLKKIESVGDAVRLTVELTGSGAAV